MKEVGLQITKARAEQGITQQELAKKAGVNYEVVTDIENGSQGVWIDELVDVAKALGHNVHISFKKPSDKSEGGLRQPSECTEAEDDGGQAMTAQGGVSKCPECRSRTCVCSEPEDE